MPAIDASTHRPIRKATNPRAQYRFHGHDGQHCITADPDQSTSAPPDMGNILSSGQGEAAAATVVVAAASLTG